MVNYPPAELNSVIFSQSSHDH